VKGQVYRRHVESHESVRFGLDAQISQEVAHQRLVDQKRAESLATLLINQIHSHEEL
jgi:hypothetical protein